MFNTGDTVRYNDVGSTLHGSEGTIYSIYPQSGNILVTFYGNTYSVLEKHLQLVKPATASVTLTNKAKYKAGDEVMPTSNFFVDRYTITGVDEDLGVYSVIYGLNPRTVIDMDVLEKHTTLAPIPTIIPPSWVTGHSIHALSPGLTITTGPITGKNCDVVFNDEFANKVCSHNWSKYTGLNSSYEYCTICDEKKKH